MVVYIEDAPQNMQKYAETRFICDVFRSGSPGKTYPGLISSETCRVPKFILEFPSSYMVTYRHKYVYVIHEIYVHIYDPNIKKKYAMMETHMINPLDRIMENYKIDWFSLLFQTRRDWT